MRVNVAVIKCLKDAYADLSPKILLCVCVCVCAVTGLTPLCALMCVAEIVAGFLCVRVVMAANKAAIQCSKLAFY